jgi:uncharacterized phage protein (TIGR02218 family)
MKTIDPALAAHFASDTTTLATCWHTTLTDGTHFCFSDHDKDIVFEGFTYVASTGVSPTTITRSADLAVSNSEISGFLGASTGGVVGGGLISEADIVGGRWDHAQVRIFVVNYEDLSMGAYQIQKGHIGEIKLEDGQRYTAEIRGQEQALATQIGSLYSLTCRAQLGDNRCKVNLEGYTRYGSVTEQAPAARSAFTTQMVEADGYFVNGLLTWLTGDNKNLVMEVSAYEDGQFSLFMPMLHRIQVGDTFKVVKGCVKTITACESFGNVLNFRGEPYIPGLSGLMFEKVSQVDRPTIGGIPIPLPPNLIVD